MSLWLYYAWHSFVNQIKKLFRTWVAIVLVCCFGLGLLLGFGAVLIEKIIDNVNEPGQTEELPEEEDPDLPDVVEKEIRPGDRSEEEDPDLPDVVFTDNTTGEVVAALDSKTILDLVATGITAALFLGMMLTADKTSIFLPADTVLLFTAPMKPQKVLMFRVGCTMGTSVFLFVYFLALSPVYISSFHINFGTMLAIIFAYVMVILENMMLKNIAYIYCAGDKKKKNVVNYSVYALAALAVVGFAAYTVGSGADSLPGNAVNYVTHGVSRWIPVIGWIKAVVLYAYEGNTAMSLLFVGLNLLTVVGSVAILNRMKADFYEPALAKSEEFANRQAAMLEQRSAVKTLSKRATDKREKIRKDGIGRGQGASVIFWKEMYNRFRFAKFGIFTKTFDTYAVFSVSVVGLLAYKGIRMMLPGALIIAAISFFRAMGNPIHKDAQMPYFAMIPERPRKKLWYSLLAGVVNTAMDAFLPLLVCAVIGGANPLEFLMWLLVIVTMDFYSTAVCCFIGLAVPQNVANGFKQFILIMFLYLGILPAAIAIIIGIASGYTAIGALIAAAVNAGVGAIFFSFLPLFY